MKIFYKTFHARLYLTLNRFGALEKIFTVKIVLNRCKPVLRLTEL